MGSKVARTGSRIGDVFDSATERAVSIKATGLVTLAIVCTLFVISTFLFIHTTPEHDWREVSTVPLEELSEADVDEPILSREQALHVAFLHLDSPGLGNVTPLGEEDIETRLVVNHTMGHIICWQLWDSHVNFTITADDGEPVLYEKYVSSIGGFASEETIRDAAIDIVSSWGGVPSDAIGPNVSCRLHSAKCIPWMDWEVRWSREKDGILTTDGIVLQFTLDGTLKFYSRDWNMALERVNTEFNVPRERAIAIAEEHNASWGVLRSCERRILRPTGHGTDSKVLYGTEPTCAWVIEYSARHCCTHRIIIHARTGEVLGLYP